LFDYALLVLLALQYGTQPLLTSRFLSDLPVDSRVVVLATELLKAALCLGPALRGTAPRGHRLRNSWAAVAPAACYLVQNLALQTAYRNLDSLSFNCLNQTKVVATAATLYMLSRQGQSPQQCLALVLVMCAGVLLQLSGEAARRETSGSSGVTVFRRGVVVRLPCSQCRSRVLTLNRCAYSLPLSPAWPRLCRKFC
jgi:UDP-sugar transporter A1/2/3